MRYTASIMVSLLLLGIISGTVYAQKDVGLSKVTLSASDTDRGDDDQNFDAGETFYVHLKLTNDGSVNLTPSDDVDVEIDIDGTKYYDDTLHVPSNLAPGNTTYLVISSNSFNDEWNDNLAKYECKDSMEVEVRVSGDVESDKGTALLTIEARISDYTLHLSVSPSSFPVDSPLTIHVIDDEGDEEASVHIRITELGSDYEWDKSDDNWKDMTESDGEVTVTLSSKFGANTSGKFQVDAYKDGYCKDTKEYIANVGDYIDIDWDANATNVSGLISSDITWTLMNSPYQLVGDVAVDEGATLTIEPGVLVNMANHTLYVDGFLSAVGTSVNNINLTAVSSGSTPPQETWFLNFRNAEGVSRLSYCNLKFGKLTGGGRLSVTNCVLDRTTVYLNGINVTFSSNIVSNITKKPLTVMSEFRFDSNTTFTNNVIFNTPFVRFVGDNIDIEHNIISENTDYGLSLSPTAGGGGWLVQHNTIANNPIGILFNSYFNSPKITNNNIISNTQYNAYYDVSYVFNTNISNNWWGTTNTTVIDQGIYDYYDDFDKGKVYYQPILTSFVSTAPTYTTTTTTTTTTSSTSTTTTTTTSTTSTTTSTSTSTLPRIEVVINEFMPRPNGTESDWIELYNNGNVNVSLAGWVLDDVEGGSQNYTIPSGVIAVRGFKVYYSNVTNINLDSTGDVVRLFNNTGGLVDNYSWGSDAGEGVSYMRSRNGGGSWTTSSSDNHPTPGESNSVRYETAFITGWNLLSLPLDVV